MESLHRTPNYNVVPPVDRRVLEAGFKKLYALFSSFETSEFPDVLIFPETTARPLAQGVKVLLEDLYARRGIPSAHIVFFQVSRVFDRIDEKMLTKLEQDQDTNQECYQAYLRDKAKYEKVRSEMNRRAYEILRYTKGKRLFIIDDTHGLGTSKKRLYDAFSAAESALDTSLSIDYFTFFYFYGDSRLDESRFGASEEEFRFYHGLFRNMKREEKEAIIGVRKNLSSAYVERSSHADHDRMQRLRDELKNIARGVTPPSSTPNKQS